MCIRDRELRGISCIDLETEESRRKSCCVSRSFGKKVESLDKLKNISNTWVKKSTNVLGAKTVMELRGIPCIDLETEETKRKSCCVSRSFGKKVESLDKLKESITTHCLNAAEKIRTDKQTTRAVTVFIRTSPFDKNRKYYSCLLYTSPSPRDRTRSRMPSSA